MTSPLQSPDLTTDHGVLPTLPSWPSVGFVIFSPQQWRILGRTLAQLHDEHEAIMQVLGQLIVGVEPLMTMPTSLEDIQNQLTQAADQAEAARSANAAEVATLKTEIDGLISVFNTHKTTLDPAVASALQAQIGRVVSASTDLVTQTGTLTAEEAAIETANPPAPVPAPPPPPAP